MNLEEDICPPPQDDAVKGESFADAAKTEAAERPKVEAYDPHFGRQAMKKDSFWRL